MTDAGLGAGGGGAGGGSIARQEQRLAPRGLTSGGWRSWQQDVALHGAVPWHRGGGGLAALDAAALGGHTGILRLLVEGKTGAPSRRRPRREHKTRGREGSSTRAAKLSPLQSALAEACARETASRGCGGVSGSSLEHLLDRRPRRQLLPASLRCPSSGRICLHWAAAGGSESAVDLLLGYWAHATLAHAAEMSAVATSAAPTAAVCARGALGSETPGARGEEEEEEGGGAEDSEIATKARRRHEAAGRRLQERACWLSGYEHGVPWDRDAGGRTPAMVAESCGFPGLAARISRTIAAVLGAAAGLKRQAPTGGSAGGGAMAQAAEASRHGPRECWKGDDGWAEDPDYAYVWPSDDEA